MSREVISKYAAIKLPFQWICWEGLVYNVTQLQRANWICSQSRKNKNLFFFERNQIVFVADYNNPSPDGKGKDILGNPVNFQIEARLYCAPNLNDYDKLKKE